MEWVYSFNMEPTLGSSYLKLLKIKYWTYVETQGGTATNYLAI